MKVTANDTLHISSVGADNIEPGKQFDVPDEIGKDLIRRGLVREAKAKPAAPANKMAAAPANKKKGK